jgi:preprotein translocase subunit SecD
MSRPLRDLLHRDTSRSKNRDSKEGMLATVKILRQRADSIGMAEPAIQFEGENHIRVKLAGLKSAWDKAEENSQPMRPDNCKTVDKALDRALAKVCSGQTDRKECITALKTLIGKLTSTQKPR